MLGLLWGDDWSVWRAAKKARSDKLAELLAMETQPNVVVNRKHPLRGITPLMAASKARHTTNVAECVRILIAYGADVNTVANTKERNTVLHYAAQNNKATAIDVMVDAGANLFAKSTSGLTALDVAWMSGRREAARVLMKRIQLCNGWLEISGKVAVPRWMRQWCVVLACDSNCSSVELCVFDRPDQVRPSRILHFGPSSTVVIPSWSSFEFHADGIDVQHRGICQIDTPAKQNTTEYAFATNGPTDRQVWVKALWASCAQTTGDRRERRVKHRTSDNSPQRTARKPSEVRQPSSSAVTHRSLH